MDITNLNSNIQTQEYMKNNSIDKKIETAKRYNNDKELLSACKEFESIFLNMMMKEMRDTVPEAGFMKKSMGKDVFEDMYFDEISKEVSNKGQGIGLAKMLYEQMKGIK
ncbi:rod-binding protein [Clostridiisalibacter paucivorans]|uniref:rod-binding protein n=1 Tax=Clostridiisalibacter paucivorans TaxID=408753 RepID=UPI00047909CC|nr:rod-binding protein [Clostridiisalibacter paucivorans]